MYSQYTNPASAPIDIARSHFKYFIVVFEYKDTCGHKALSVTEVTEAGGEIADLCIVAR